MHSSSRWNRLTAARGSTSYLLFCCFFSVFILTRCLSLCTYGVCTVCTRIYQWHSVFCICLKCVNSLRSYYTNIFVCDSHLVTFCVCCYGCHCFFSLSLYSPLLLLLFRRQCGQVNVSRMLISINIHSESSKAELECVRSDRRYTHSNPNSAFFSSIHSFI